MAPGYGLSLQMRQLVARRLMVGTLPNRIFKELNPDGSRHGVVSLRHLQRLAFLRRTRPAAEWQCYLTTLGKRTGRKRLMSAHDLHVLDQLNDEDDSSTLVELAQQLYDTTGTRVSERTVRRALKQLGLTRKMYTFIPGNADAQQVLDHMRILRSTDYRNIVDFDETHYGGASKAAARRGRSKGRCKKKEPDGAGKMGTYMAAVSVDGVMCWAKYEDNCASAHFIDFVERFLAPALHPRHTLIYDNAPQHLTVDAVAAVEEATGGMYKRVPAWCHWLSPVERLFSMVWRRVRKLQRTCSAQGITLDEQINNAFFHYAVGQPGSVKCKNLFNVYKRNNAQYRFDQLEAIRNGVLL